VKVLKFAVVAGLIASIGAAASANAQVGAASPLHFGLAAGASLPASSDFRDAVNVGYNLTGLVQITAPGMPVGFRVDGSYNSFGAKGGGAKASITDGTANVVFGIPSSTPVSLYLIGGPGYYHENVSVSGFGSASENHWGFNAGVGVKLPLSGLNTFVEARYHYIAENGTSSSFVPVTFGIVF
jgi:hypothetical protein